MTLKNNLPKTLSRHKTAAGFSLLEILVAMAIMAILGGIMVGAFMGETEKAKLERIRGDITVLENAIMRYHSDNFLLPSTEQGLEALVSKPSQSPTPNSYPRGGYIRKLKSDPWGNPYQYVSPGEHGEFDIYSFGADGQEGGEGKAADIGNWNVEEVIKELKAQG